jgi:PadR family transcriptional regulator, regulatory protein PadR
MSPSKIVPGTLDLLILKALSLSEMHGLGIARRIEQITGNEFEVKPGSLFPALHRMEQAGWVRSAAGKSENRRDAKYYRLTRKGRRQLGIEQRAWSNVAAAITSALRTTG